MSAIDVPSNGVTPDFRILPVGDTAISVEFGDSISRETNQKVLDLAAGIEAAGISGIVETAATFRSLLVMRDPTQISFEALARAISAIPRKTTLRGTAARTWRIPVCYDRAVAEDIEEVAARVGVSSDEFASIHASVAHHVYMLGFLPGQPYLGDLPERISLPRRLAPRAKVAAGSVGIAMRMTCVFPRESPCGLNVVGRTPAPLSARALDGAPSLAPGDGVRFRPITLGEFERLAGEASAGASILELEAPAPSVQAT
ncbi:MAG: allophanate hydrolase subunit 1 [Hyphomicrobiales bacterium]|nr:allophanate hydrolase subunit 1 [Hyphomicrobiales bacterium]